MRTPTADAHVYADSVECPNCKAKVGRACTFVHFATKERIATAYCSARLQRWMRKNAPDPRGEK